MVERRQRVRLAAAELGDEREDGRGVLSLARQSLEHHSAVLSQGSGEIGAREELCRIAVVFGGTARDNLLQRDRKFVGIEGTSLAHFLAG